jgi:hypothetical protein
MKKPILILASLALGSLAIAQLIPISPADRTLSEIDRAASASRFHAENYAQSLAVLHSKIFLTDDVALAAALEAIQQPASEQLLGLYFASAQGINQILAATGSSVRAPEQASREWTWNGTNVYVVPLPTPLPTPEPTPEPTPTLEP